MTARGLNVEPLARAAGPTVRDAVFQLLREHGLTTIFGNPGSTELPMFRDMPADFRYVLGLQESVAVGMADGPAAGLAIVDGLMEDRSLRQYHWLPSVRADLLSKLGRSQEARGEFERAAAMASNEREKEFLLERAAAMRLPPS